MEQFASIERRPFCGGANIHEDKPCVYRRLRPVASKRVENGNFLSEFRVTSLKVGGLSRGAHRRLEALALHGAGQAGGKLTSIK